MLYSYFMTQLDMPNRQTTPMQHTRVIGSSFRCLDKEGKSSVLYLPGLSRDFDCFDFSLEWDGMSGMEVVFDSLIFWSVLIV